MKIKEIKHAATENKIEKDSFIDYANDKVEYTDIPILLQTCLLTNGKCVSK